MDKDKIFDFYEKVYFNGLGETNAIIARFPVLIASVALIINAYIFLFNFGLFKDMPRLAVGGILAVIFFSITMLLYCLLRTFSPKPYERMPDLTLIEQYKRDLIDYNEQEWEEDFKENMVKDITEASVVNEKLNQERRDCFHKAISWIWINLCLCIMMPIGIIFTTLWI